MSNTTLDITRADIKRQVGRFLGWDRNSSNWTANEATDISDAIAQGERMFYAPPVLPGERTAHRWSFLRPSLSLSISAGITDYDLPVLWGGFVERLAYSSSDNVPYRYLKETSLTEIQERRQLDVSTALQAVPFLFATYPLDAPQEVRTAPQRFKITFYPSPINDYTLVGPYYLNPYSTDDTNSYPLGGQPHAETLLTACLAAADLVMNQNTGVQMGKFMMLLHTSVSIDRGAHGPFLFGYNGDDSVGGQWNNRRHLGSEITYGGQSYLT